MPGILGGKQAIKKTRSEESRHYNHPKACELRINCKKCPCDLLAGQNRYNREKDVQKPQKLHAEVRTEGRRRMLHFFATFATTWRTFTVKGFRVAKSSRKRYNFNSPAYSRQPEGTVVSSDRRVLIPRNSKFIEPRYPHVRPLKMGHHQAQEGRA